MANRIVEFYSGRAPDHQGRMWNQILGWDDPTLEAVHDYIQWLFPLPEPSPVNPRAPVIDPETIGAFEAQPELRANLRRSFERMLAFYGLALESGDPCRVTRRADFAGHAGNWLRPGNHNHLRLTRILKSARLLSLPSEARALFACLEQIYASQPGAITVETLRFWRSAAL
jgi:hypothetical protein